MTYRDWLASHLSEEQRSLGAVFYRKGLTARNATRALTLAMYAAAVHATGGNKHAAANQLGYHGSQPLEELLDETVPADYLGSGETTLRRVQRSCEDGPICARDLGRMMGLQLMTARALLTWAVDSGAIARVPAPAGLKARRGPPPNYYWAERGASLHMPTPVDPPGRLERVQVAKEAVGFISCTEQLTVSLTDRELARVADTLEPAVPSAKAAYPWFLAAEHAEKETATRVELHHADAYNSRVVVVLDAGPETLSFGHALLKACDDFMLRQPAVLKVSRFNTDDLGWNTFNEQIPSVIQDTTRLLAGSTERAPRKSARLRTLWVAWGRFGPVRSNHESIYTKEV